MTRPYRMRTFLSTALILFVSSSVQSQPTFRSHPPMRPLPEVSQQKLGNGPSHYVDATKGDDESDGTLGQPWKSIKHALRQLQPGDTLCLRGGTYYENVDFPLSGSEDLPITIRSYPGELATIDGGLREFFETPESCWTPHPDGAAHEYVSTRTYPQFSARPIVSAFPAAGWEPLYGKEDERPVVLGHFGDSMVPLHSYRILKDLRDDSMLWDIGSKFDKEASVYCGPGLWFNRKTERIHIRLAPVKMAGLGQRAYTGETDPRKLPLAISGPYGKDVLRLNGVRHIVIQDLAVRGASGSALVNMYGSDGITFDGVTFFGGAPGLLSKATNNVRILNCAFRGLAAPWSSRASMKYRGTPSYVLITQRNQPLNSNWEIAHCEFTDSHDGLWIRYVHGLKFHHNYMDNFNDDGLEFGARKRDQLIHVYQNLISRCLLTLTLHQMEKDESPAEVDPGSGVFITRNVFDLRRGTFKGPPKEPDPTGSYLNGGVTLCGDHGGPTWPDYYFYHNTVLRTDAAWRGYYGFGIGAQGTRGNSRRVLNNIFVQVTGLPGLNFTSAPDDAVLDGNLHWGMLDGPAFTEDFFKKHAKAHVFRKSGYPTNWMKKDQFANPDFMLPPRDSESRIDVRVQNDSPAIDSGVELPEDWFDPIQMHDSGPPDIGAFPSGQSQWSVGIQGRIPVTGKPE